MESDSRQAECFKSSFSKVGTHYCFMWGQWCWPSSCHWWQTAYNLREYFEGSYNVRWVLYLFGVGMWNDEVQFLLQALRFSQYDWRFSFSGIWYFISWLFLDCMEPKDGGMLHQNSGNCLPIDSCVISEDLNLHILFVTNLFVVISF
jgi:hypothetical protein